MLVRDLQRGREEPQRQETGGQGGETPAQQLSYSSDMHYLFGTFRVCVNNSSQPRSKAVPPCMRAVLFREAGALERERAHEGRMENNQTAFMRF